MEFIGHGDIPAYYVSLPEGTQYGNTDLKLLRAPIIIVAFASFIWNGQGVVKVMT